MGPQGVLIPHGSLTSAADDVRVRLIWMRIALLVLGGLLGVVLLARGAVLVGAILLAMTVLRACMLVSIQRRRKRFVAARPAWLERQNRVSRL